MRAERLRSALIPARMTGQRQGLLQMLKEYVKYYYQALSPEQRAAYLTLYKGIRDHAPEIRITGLNTEEELPDVIVAVYNDTPGFFYLDAKHMQWLRTESGCLIYQPRYLYSLEKSLEYERKLADGLEIFYRRFIRADMSEYEREKVIHDYLVRTITYDHAAVQAGDDTIDEAFNVLGALLKRKAVCWGIALAFKLLCDYCRVKTFVVVGSSSADWAGDDHAWNIVKLDGKEYHVDVTWDIKEKGELSFRYDYFNLSDDLIRFDHSWMTSLYPPCREVTFNYYRRHQLYVKRKEDISSYVGGRLGRGERYIAFKFAGNMPDSDTIEREIVNGCLQGGVRTSIRYAISQKTHNIYVEVIDTRENGK